ncbi:intraflagellar transport protein 80 homolog isoform X4 [Pieris brassicae]|uniref:intraflagellar transport protein 80 homolog isoform X4 n=1 Tax=Pieris brassicae TaxID=7116 RepID=UPI001E65E958|nr:intraflagellar transport protein 80 homolog isoform X4 [Pieris brassicae]
MKLKISTFKEPKHTAVVTCVCWNNTEDVFSCSDDHKLLKWNLINNECMTVAAFAEDFFPTSMNLFPKTGQSGVKHQHDVILISTADGKFHIVNHNGRIEKSVVAHQGACLTAQWSPDGAGLLTGGEDGFVKIWSRNGLLRSSIVQSDVPCFNAKWSPDSGAILYTKGNCLVIKHLNSNSKINKWKAHEGLILCVAWNPNHNLIISGGEDGYAKIWDTFGQQVSISVKHDQPLTSVTWSPTGNMFVLGSYNLIRLCDLNGRSYCLDRPSTGSIYSISWSSDGTQLAAACANCHVLFAHIIERCICVVERAGVSVYSYMGRLLASPRIPRPETIGQATISLGPDTLAVIDHADRKLIQVFDLPTGLIVRSSTDNTVTKLTHKMTVSCIALSQTGPLNERQLALLDYNRDLYVVTVKETKPKMFKLGPQVLSITWSSETELLVGLRANSVVAWCCPRAATQPDWLTLTTVSKDISDLGRNPSIMNIEDGVVCVRRGNGSLLRISLASFPEKLLKHIAANMWDDALQLCRTVEDETLWACLAVLAWQYNQLPVAEEAFALIHQYHQVYYIQHLRNAIPEKLTTSQTLNSKTVLSN